jgi:hypothetical protein
VGDRAVDAVAIFWQSFSRYAFCVRVEGEVAGLRWQCYPGEAPSAIATCRKAGRKGNDAGRCSTMRRTETTTRVRRYGKQPTTPKLEC